MLSNAIASRLTEAKLRVTIRRVQVLQLFMERPQWQATIDQIFRTLVDQGVPLRVTDVYRIVRSLESHGLLTKGWAAGKIVPLSVYALRGDQSDDARGQHRFVCRLCQQCTDFQDEPLQREIERASGLHGFAIEAMQPITFSGVCRRCAGLSEDVSGSPAAMAPATGSRRASAAGLSARPPATTT